MSTYTMTTVAGVPCYCVPCDELDALRAQLAEANARYDEYVIAIGGKYSEATRLIIDLREDLRLWVHRHDEACSQLASMTAARDLWLQRHEDLTIGLAASEARVGRLTDALSSMRRNTAAQRLSGFIEYVRSQPSKGE